MAPKEASKPAFYIESTIEPTPYDVFIHIMFLDRDHKPEADIVISTDEFTCHLKVIDGLSALYILTAQNLDSLAGSNVHALLFRDCPATWHIDALAIGYHGVPIDHVPAIPMPGESLPRIHLDGFIYSYLSVIPVLVEPGVKIYIMTSVPADYKYKPWLRYNKVPYGVEVYLHESFHGFCFMDQDIPVRAIEQ